MRQFIFCYMSSPNHDGTSLAARLRDVTVSLPRGERRVARTLLNAYPIAGLGTLADLAERSGVSAPTVLRLLTRLGFEGFSDFQRALHIELNERLADVYEDYTAEAFDERGIGAASLAQAVRTVDATARSFTEEEFAATVRLLADPRFAVYAVGGTFSQPLALLLALHLGVLRHKVRALPYGSAELVDALAQAGRRDVLVAFDFRRYTEPTLALARHVVQRRGHVVLITDRWLSPIASFAEHVLVARTDSVSAFDSLLAATALTEALVAGVSGLLEDSGRARAEAIARLEAQMADKASGTEGGPAQDGHGR
jgi:DNA-binding MurR/RpiR family transcriptional regulator